MLELVACILERSHRIAPATQTAQRMPPQKQKLGMPRVAILLEDGQRLVGLSECLVECAYCERLLPMVRSCRMDKLLSELRHGYRLGAEAKLQYFGRAR